MEVSIGRHMDTNIIEKEQDLFPALLIRGTIENMIYKIEYDKICTY